MVPRAALLRSVRVLSIRVSLHQKRALGRTGGCKASDPARYSLRGIPAENSMVSSWLVVLSG